MPSICRIFISSKETIDISSPITRPEFFVDLTKAIVKRPLKLMNAVGVFSFFNTFFTTSYAIFSSTKLE